MKQNGFGLSVFDEKEEQMKQGIRYCKAWQISKCLIWKSGARTHIYLINIYRY